MGALATTTGTAACTRQAARCLALGRTVARTRGTSTRSRALCATAIRQASSATESSAAREHAAKASQAGESNLEFTLLTHPSSSTFRHLCATERTKHTVSLTVANHARAECAKL